MSSTVNFNSFPYTFRTLHGFTLQETGLSFLGVGVGMITAALSQPYWHK